MNKYIIWTVIFAVIVIFALYGFSNNTGVNSSSSKVASVIIVVEPIYDFGDIDIFGGKVSTTYTLKNNGYDDVSILSAITSCMCTEGEIGGMRFGMHGQTNKNVIIPAGGEKILTAIYDPLAHGPDGTGKVTRELILTTNSSETAEIKVKFLANVIKNKNN